MEVLSRPLEEKPVKAFMDFEVEIGPFERRDANPDAPYYRSTRLLAGMPQGVFRPERVKVTELKGKPVICLNGRYVELEEFPEFGLCRDMKDEVLGERYFCSQSHTVQVGELLTFMLINNTSETCKFKIRVDGTTIGTRPGRIGFFELWIPEEEAVKRLADLVKKAIENS